MNTEFTVSIDGYELLERLLEENQQLTAELSINMSKIESVRLKINGKIKQLPVGADN